MHLRARAAAAVASVIAVGALASGCGGSDEPERSAGESSPSTSSSPSPSAQATAGADPTTAGKRASRPPDRLAPARIAPVIRNGERPRPSIGAEPAGLRGRVVYRDGVRLRVDRVTAGRSTGNLPGDLSGSTLSFAITMTNGTTRRLDLSNVVVTVVYGRPGRLAQAVYGLDDVDLAGRVGAGRSVSASYTYLVPRGRSPVTVHVDFDARHTAAVFSGTP